MKILITEPKEIAKEAIELLQKNGITTILSDSDYDKVNIEALFIRTYTLADDNYLQQFPRLRYVLRAGVGLDNIDLEACKRRNIEIISAPGSNANSVAEFVIGAIIFLMRNVVPHMQSLARGEWRIQEKEGEEVKGKVIGIVGCGAIGTLIAEKLQTFHIKDIVGYDPFLNEEQLMKKGIKKVTLDELIAKADVITIHLPLIEETKKMFNMRIFKKMKKGSYLINTARGGIVDENDLQTAIRDGIIKGAFLDVFESEPNVRKELLSNPQILASPHIAAYTHEATIAMSLMPAEILIEKIKQ